MQQSVFLFFFCSLFSSLSAEEPFGYISASTMNIGDDVQALAAKRFLPADAVAVDREFISEFFANVFLKTVVSGWFMHDKNGYWDLRNPPPEKSWPPSQKIDPFFISIHLTGTFLPTVFSEENIDYLRASAPIGARDLFTLNELQKRNIPSYFSGCLTLTLENHFEKRNDIIYLVDLDAQSINYIRSKTKSPIVVISHGKAALQLLKNEQRLKYAEYFLNLYRQAKCVVTTRLHAAMPCLAFETPLLFCTSIGEGGEDARFSGLSEHTWHCAAQELCNGECDYDFENPPPNPNTHFPMRENLINIMTDWVFKNS